MTFNKKLYLKFQAWLEDEYLMRPNGVKKCQVCNKWQYAIEFVNWREYQDGKLPVCNSCFNRPAFSAILGASLIQNSGFTKKCGKCGVERPLAEMRMGFRSNEVLDICRHCEW